MRLCVIGAGYVGLVSGACLADAGNDVICVDKDEKKLAYFKENRIPIYEPGLLDIVRKNKEEGRLTFSSNLGEGLKSSEICFITVDTPPGEDGRADLTNVLAVADQIGQLLSSPTIVVTKSTVPVGTTMRVKDVIMKRLVERGIDQSILDVASNPEFLKEGNAVADFTKPDRIIVGCEREEVAEKLHQLYSPFMLRRDRFLKMSIASAELSKYASNAMLATRISFMNEMARLCEAVSADIGDIRKSLGSDSRIGSDFLYAGLGYGGSCFPKDTKAVVELGKEHGTHLSIIESTERINNSQREWFWNKIVKHFGGIAGLKDKSFALWGLAFKANTDDVRFAPSLYFIERLLESGARVAAFDPVAADAAKAALGRKAKEVHFVQATYEAVEGADALLICTEWREFRSPDFERMKSLMRTPVIFDGRNLYDSAVVQGFGFQYTGVGRGTPKV